MSHEQAALRLQDRLPPRQRGHPARHERGDRWQGWRRPSRATGNWPSTRRTSTRRSSSSARSSSTGSGRPRRRRSWSAHVQLDPTTRSPWPACCDRSDSCARTDDLLAAARRAAGPLRDRRPRCSSAEAALWAGNLDADRPRGSPRHLARGASGAAARSLQPASDGVSHAAGREAFRPTGPRPSTGPRSISSSARRRAAAAALARCATGFSAWAALETSRVPSGLGRPPRPAPQPTRLAAGRRRRPSARSRQRLAWSGERRRRRRGWPSSCPRRRPTPPSTGLSRPGARGVGGSPPGAARTRGDPRLGIDVPRLHVPRRGGARRRATRRGRRSRFAGSGG